MKRYTWEDGYSITSKLSIKEVVKRMNRLDTLRVLTEQSECEIGKSICKKALNAYNKKDNFTGVIRLTNLEKDWLSYMLESDFNTEEDIKTIKFYCRIKECEV